MLKKNKIKSKIVLFISPVFESTQNIYIVVDNVSVGDDGNDSNSHRIDQTTALKLKVNYLDYSEFQCNTTNICGKYKNIS